MDSSPENQLSFAFEPKPRHALLNQDLKPLLENLQVASRDKSNVSPLTHLWVQFPAEAVDKAIHAAGLNRSVLLQQSSLPVAYVPITPELKEAVEKITIYPAHGDNVFLVLADSGALHTKYQTILGGRQLSADNPDFLQKMTQKLTASLAAGLDFTNPVERFRPNSESGHGSLIENGNRISALLSEIGSVFDGVDSRLKTNAKPSSAAQAPASVAASPPQLARGLRARAVAGGRASNASDAVLADLAQLFVDPATPQFLLLPSNHLANYAKIKALVTTAGGKYNSKGYFAFPEGIDPSSVQQTLLNGSVVNDKKDFQFFATPRSEALDLCDRAGPLAGKRVLEPSAGDGALADIARERGAEVTVIENWSVNVAKLKAKGYDVLEKDFLSVTTDDIGMFDVILANPPFSKNQDIDHVRHMLSFLEPGGVLSVITSQAWEGGSQKKQQEFAELLMEIGAEITPVASGAFKESGTDVPTFKIVIQQPLGLDAELDKKSNRIRP